MKGQKVLTSRFNMSLGFVPVITSIILCQFIDAATAVYIGTGIGLLWLLWYGKSGISSVILYGSTGSLLLLSLAAALCKGNYPPHAVPLLLEAGAVVPAFLFLAGRKYLIGKYKREQKPCSRFFTQDMEASVVSARLASILGGIHALAILPAAFGKLPEETGRLLLFSITPAAVLIASIAINQLGIYYFNRIAGNIPFVPVVNKQGEVIGKESITEALCPQNNHLHPIVRIAVTAHGMLYLRPRPKHLHSEAGKTDLGMESILLYGESVMQCAKRIVRQMLPDIPAEKLHFNLTYCYPQKHDNRLVYLFTLDLGKDDTPLCHAPSQGGKLWTFRQIKENLCRNYFSKYLEYEYEYLKSIIYTREKYRES